MSWLSLLRFVAADPNGPQRAEVQKIEGHTSVAAGVQAIAVSLFAFGALVQLTSQLYLALGLTIAVNIVLPAILERMARRAMGALVPNNPVWIAWAAYYARMTCLLAVLIPSIWVLKH